jgi:hypothetical protein
MITSKITELNRSDDGNWKELSVVCQGGQRTVYLVTATRVITVILWRLEAQVSGLLRYDSPFLARSFRAPQRLHIQVEAV